MSIIKTINLPIEPEAKNVFRNQFLIPHVIENGINAINWDRWISKTKNTLQLKRERIEMISNQYRQWFTIEFSCNEDDTGLFDGFSETLMLDFSITNLIIDVNEMRMKKKNIHLL